MKSRFMSLVHPDSQECPIQILCGNLLWRETFNSLGIKRAFSLLQNVKRPELFNETIPLRQL